MNWEALGAIGEIIGAAAVLITLVYLAVQIRQNTRQIGDSTRALRLTSRDTTQQAFSRWRHFVSEPEAADLYLRGCADYGSLFLAERFRFGIFLQDLLLSYEALHQQIPESLYEREVWDQRQIPILAHLFRQPGVRNGWEQNKLMFLPDFAAAIDRAASTASSGQPAV